MASRQTNRQTGTTAPGQGGGLGAPGTTGATGARDPLGAPGSTGASRTNMGAPGYDPAGYGTAGGEQQQLHRSSAGAGTEQGYTYGTAGSMEPTAGGYQAGVPTHATGVTGTYGTTGGYEPGYYSTGTAGVGGEGGYDTGRGMGEQTHGGARERTEHIEVTGSGDQTRVFEEMGGDRARGVGGGGERGGTLGGYDTGGRKEREGQQRGG